MVKKFKKFLEEKTWCVADYALPRQRELVNKRISFGELSNQDIEDEFLRIEELCGCYIYINVIKYNERKDLSYLDPGNFNASEMQITVAKTFYKGDKLKNMMIKIEEELEIIKERLSYQGIKMKWNSFKKNKFEEICTSTYNFGTKIHLWV